MIYDREFSSIGEIMPKVMEYLEKKSNANTKIIGMKSGFEDLDYKIEGLHNGELIVVGARPGMGKSALILNIMLYAAIEENIPVAIFSIENGKETVINRMLSMQAEVENSKIISGKIAKEELNKIKESSKILSNAPIYINDTPGISAEEIREKSIKLKEEKNIGLIVIDYLQLIGQTEEESNHKNILESISNLAKELNIPIILTSQLSRKPEERKDHTPRLSDFGNSHDITDYADTILFLYRDGYYNPDSDKKDIADIIIERSAHGAKGTIELLWNSKYMKFDNMERIKMN